MPKFDNQTIQKENLLILEGNPPKPISCHRFDLLVTIQDFLVASEVLGYDPLSCLRQLFPTFTWEYVKIPDKVSEAIRNQALQQIVISSDYFWMSNIASDEEWVTARRKQCDSTPYMICGSIADHNRAGLHWDIEIQKIVERLKSYGARKCPD